MDNKPILFEDKMKYRDNEFLYDKCIKQHDCIKNYQWKMREYKDIINRAIECIDNREWVDCEECVNQVYNILRGDNNGNL